MRRHEKLSAPSIPAGRISIRQIRQANNARLTRCGKRSIEEAHRRYYTGGQPRTHGGPGLTILLNVPMKLITLRIISGSAGLFALTLAIFLSRGIVNWGVNAMTLGLTASPGTAAGLLFWFALRAHSERDSRIIASGWKWGFIIGAIGFALGFIIVPIIATVITGRDLPQAPLLGIFITGPGAFPIGVLVGVLIEVRRRNIS